MKVVPSCRGYGTRMRNGRADDVARPMRMVGPRQLLWHVPCYAHFGRRGFVRQITEAGVAGPGPRLVITGRAGSGPRSYRVDFAAQGRGRPRPGLRRT